MTIVSGQSNGTVEVTPSGIPVFYQSQPKRLYRIGANLNEVAQTTENPSLLEAAQEELAGWSEVPSVTTVLGVLDKSGPLIWWGQRVGIAGALTLFHSGERIEPYPTGTRFKQDDVYVQQIVDWLTSQQLTTNHVRDAAGDRGQAVHDALENWARYGHRPDPSIYPEEQEGYVRGLLAFLDDVPSAEPEGAEVLVASVEYGYAGRYDLRLRTNEPHEVVVRRTATRVKKRELKPGRYLADLKTSAGAYPSHALQLAAYEQASIESGYEPTDGRGVLIVSKDGFYEFKRTKATADDFHAVLEVYNRMQHKKEWL